VDGGEEKDSVTGGSRGGLMYASSKGKQKGENLYFGFLCIGETIRRMGKW